MLNRYCPVDEILKQSMRIDHPFDIDFQEEERP
jgi:hypothetical protein